MKSLGLGFGYFCIYTTPIQLFLLGWILLYIFQTPYGFLDLSSKIFLKQNLEFFHDWICSWFWNAYLDFWWQFPAFIMLTLKTILSTCLGFYLVKKFK